MKQLLAVLLAACVFGGIAQAQFAIAIDGQGQTYHLNPITGTATLKGSTGLNDTNAMTRFHDWQVYVASGNGGGTSTIYAINWLIPTQATPVASVPLGNIRALARRPPNEIYAIQDGLSPSGPDALYRIDLTLGTATLIGPTGFAGVEALTFAGGNTFYAWDVGDGSGNGAGLLTIDTSTGIGTDVNPSVGGTDAVQTLSYWQDQHLLYGGRDAFYVIKPTTGEIALVGSGGYTDLRGMEFVSLDVAFSCVSKVSSLGCNPYTWNSSSTVSKSGSPAAPIVAGPVPGGPNLPGILLFGTTHTQPILTSFGHLCLANFKRAGAFATSPGGDAGFCNGIYGFDLAAIAAAYPTVLVGDGLWLQVWYRDPGFPPPGNANFTNDLGPITVVP
jgi:hypothetical protein